MKNYIGIWMDQKQAKMIQFENEQAKIQTIESEIEDFHVVGGARSKTPWGPMDNVSENKMLQRKKQQTQKYFQKIVELLKGNDELYLFGPAEMKSKLVIAINDNKAINVTIRKVDTADKMSDKQMVAQVKKVFGLDSTNN